MFTLPKSAGIRFEGKRLDIYEAFILLIRTTSSFDRKSDIFKFIEVNTKLNFNKDLSQLYSYLKDKGFIIDNLHYLDNYYYEHIGGILKGICRLDGTFNSFNLVKYADYESIKEELEIITSEFPFLDITATIYDNCISEDSKKPLFSFKLKDGKLEESNEHLSSLPYVHVIDEYLNYNHLNMFSKLLTKHFYDITTDNLDWCVEHKRFHSLL